MKYWGTYRYFKQEINYHIGCIKRKRTPKKEAYEISGYASIFLTRKSYQISCIQMICDAIKKGIPQQTEKIGMLWYKSTEKRIKKYPEKHFCRIGVLSATFNLQRTFSLPVHKT